MPYPLDDDTIKGTRMSCIFWEHLEHLEQKDLILEQKDLILEQKDHIVELLFCVNIVINTRNKIIFFSP